MDNPLQGTEPPIQELAPWWPIIVFLISVAMTAISSAWAAYLSYNEWKRKRAEKLIDAEKEHALQSVFFLSVNQLLGSLAFPLVVRQIS